MNNNEMLKKIKKSEKDIVKLDEQLDNIETQKAEKQAVNLLENRINELTKLEGGSTTADAELIDARIDVYGVVHQNLGEAIRQIGLFINKITTTGKNLFDKNSVTKGYYYYNGSKRENTNLCYYKIPVSQNEQYTTNIPNVYIQFHDKNDDYISSFVTNGVQTFTVPLSATYMYVSCYMSESDKLQTEKGDKSTFYEAYRKKLVNDTTITEEYADTKYVRKEENNVVKEENPIYIVNGDVKLLDIIEEALLKGNATIYIKKDIDILEELGAEYIETYKYGTANYTDGYPIGNDMHIICDSNVKITCNYTGNNADFKRYFSPFAVHKAKELKSTTFTFTNVTLECSDVRYCVHDELFNRDKFGIHKFENCNFTFVGGSCIGTGSGLNQTYIYENCHFNGGIFWHTSIGGDGVCYVYITNCYFNNKYRSILLNQGGTGIVKSRIIISNCKLGSEIYMGHSYGFENDNGIELIEYNNVI